MTSRERFFEVLRGKRPDHLALMPITMQFAADRIGRKYYDYVTDCRVLVEGQLRVAEEFGVDHVGCISDPAREATDWRSGCYLSRRFSARYRRKQCAAGG